MSIQEADFYPDFDVAAAYEARRLDLIGFVSLKPASANCPGGLRNWKRTRGKPIGRASRGRRKTRRSWTYWGDCRH